MVDFENVINRMKDFGFKPNPDIVNINIPNAKANIIKGFDYFVGDKYTWLNEYDDIAEWCENNNGRGLLIMGNCGLGKTLICGKILPILINHYCQKVIYITNAQLLNKDIDFILKQHLIYIDDIGTESVSVKFGERRLPFAELVDEAEKKGKLLIITTNLTPEEIEEKYGTRTIDRLHSITKAVKLSGKSFRK